MDEPLLSTAGDEHWLEILFNLSASLVAEAAGMRKQEPHKYLLLPQSFQRQILLQFLTKLAFKIFHFFYLKTEQGTYLSRFFKIFKGNCRDPNNNRSASPKRVPRFYYVLQGTTFRELNESLCTLVNMTNFSE